MKGKRFYAWIGTTKQFKQIGWYLAFDNKRAKILAQADAIKMGLDHKLVKVEEEK